MAVLHRNSMTALRTLRTLTNSSAITAATATFNYRRVSPLLQSLKQCKQQLTGRLTQLKEVIKPYPLKSLLMLSAVSVNDNDDGGDVLMKLFSSFSIRNINATLSGSKTAECIR